MIFFNMYPTESRHVDYYISMIQRYFCVEIVTKTNLSLVEQEFKRRPLD